MKLIVNSLKNLQRKAARNPLILTILTIQTLIPNALNRNRSLIVKKREVEAVALRTQQKVVTRNARSLRNQRENAALSQQIQIKQALHLLILIAHQISPRKVNALKSLLSLRKRIAKKDKTATRAISQAAAALRKKKTRTVRRRSANGTIRRRTVARRGMIRRESITLTHLIDTAAAVTVIITAIDLTAAIRMEKNSAVAVHTAAIVLQGDT